MADSEIGKLRAEIEQLRAATVAQFRAPNLPLRRVVETTGVPESAIRNWLTRDQLNLTADKTRTKGQHRMFSARDAVFIALAWRMTAHGLPISGRGGLIGDFVHDIDEMIASHRQSQERVYLTWPSIVGSSVGSSYTYKSHSAGEPFDLSSIPPSCTVFQPLRIAWETLHRLGWETPLGERQSNLSDGNDDGGGDA